MKEAQYRVIEHKSDKFSIELDGVVVEAVARGRLKRDGEILVGDFVVLDENMTEPVIARVAPRRNFLVRPGVANIDLVVIVVAPVPETDGFLVDKLIVNCKEAGIDCLICLNKSDIANTERERLVREYGTDVAGVVVTAAINGEAAELKPYLTGKVVCFAGQSAVGKSTLSNAILGGEERTVGELSERISRGRNTTTSARLLRSPDGFYFVDTPGFSVLDTFGVKANELALYYDEYVRLSDDCKFHPCTHTSEPGCAVKAAVGSGNLSRERYERYVKLYGDLREAEKRRTK